MNTVYSRYSIYPANLLTYTMANLFIKSLINTNPYKFNKNV